MCWHLGIPLRSSIFACILFRPAIVNIFLVFICTEFLISSYLSSSNHIYSDFGHKRYTDYPSRTWLYIYSLDNKGFGNKTYSDYPSRTWLYIYPLDSKGLGNKAIKNKEEANKPKPKKQAKQKNTAAEEELNDAVPLDESDESSEYESESEEEMDPSDLINAAALGREALTAMKMVWESLNPPVKQEDILGRWYGLIYAHRDFSKHL